MAVTHSRRKTEWAATVASKRSRNFDLKHFLTTIGEGRTIGPLCQFQRNKQFTFKAHPVMWCFTFRRAR
jgi:hypothetical protein